MPTPTIAASITREVGGANQPREGAAGAVEAVAAWPNLTMMGLESDGRAA